MAVDDIPEFTRIHTDHEYKIYINGIWRISDSERVIEIRNPLDRSFVGSIQSGTKNDIELAIKAARDEPCWKEFSLEERASILKNAADLMLEWAQPLGDLLVREIGKPRKSAVSEIKRTADIFTATAEATNVFTGETILGDELKGAYKNKISITMKVPLGVVACIGPFNYPFNLTGSKVAPALLAGNTVVVKPPTVGSITALHLGVILEQAGVPAGVINIVTGPGGEIGDYLVSHPIVKMVSFTGSSTTGNHIAKVSGLKPLLMELGGKDAAIVLEDADLEKTADAIVSGAFSFSGQRCTAVKRVLALPGIADHLIDEVTKRTKRLTVGDPALDVDLGPLISTDQCEYVQGLIDDAIVKGAKITCGNRREGSLMWPTVLDQVTTGMRIAWEEPFGPVLPIIRVQSLDEAIEISNKSEYGLQGMIFTQNLDLAMNVAQELEVGTVQINGESSRGPDHFPFLGTKSSGLGTQGIKYAIESMTRPRVIVLNLSEKGKLLDKCKGSKKPSKRR